jgi:hypothetical protein
MWMLLIRAHVDPALVEPSSSSMDPKLLEMLVCPVTKGPLIHDRERGELVSRSARLAHPIRDGTGDARGEAQAIPEEWEALKD